MSTSEFYVYVWHEDRVPLYVGKGRGARAASHLRNKPWAEGRIVECAVYRFPSEEWALYAEGVAIAAMGMRRDGKAGVLFNRRLPKFVYPDEGTPEADDSLLALLYGFKYPNLQILDWLSNVPEIPCADDLATQLAAEIASALRVNPNVVPFTHTAFQALEAFGVHYYEDVDD